MPDKSLEEILKNDPLQKKKGIKVEFSNEKIPPNIIQGIQTLKEIAATYEKRKTG